MLSPLKIGFCRPFLHLGLGGVNFAVDTLSGIHEEGNIEIISIFDLASALKIKCDIYHFHGIWVWWFPIFALYLKINSIPYVISPHGMLAPWSINKLSYLKKLFFKFISFSISGAYSIVVASDYECDLVRLYFPSTHVHVICLASDYNSSCDHMNARKRLHLDDAKNNLVYLSRVSHNKGLELLISALIDLPIKSKLRVFIVGDGDKALLNALKLMSINYQSRLPEIIWVGPVWDDSKWDYMQAADLFCLPTLGENFGFAILESLWVGTPVITSNFTPWKGLIGAQKGMSFINLDVESIRQSITSFFNSASWSEHDRISLSNWTKRNFSYSAMKMNYITYYRNLYEG